MNFVHVHFAIAARGFPRADRGTWEPESDVVKYDGRSFRKDVSLTALLHSSIRNHSHGCHVRILIENFTILAKHSNNKICPF